MEDFIYILVYLDLDIFKILGKLILVVQSEIKYIDIYNYIKKLIFSTYIN